MIFLNYKKRHLSIIILLAIFLAFFVFIPYISAETGAKKALEGLNTSVREGYGSTKEGSGVVTNIPSAIGKIVGAGLAFIGVIFLILMIYGGFTWMFARGNEQEVAKAKDLIYSAVIGLIIVLAAYALTRYLGQALGLI